MSDLLEKAIEDVRESEISFCKYIQANDTKATESHQSGYHLSKSSWPLYFRSPGVKGEKKDAFVTVKWQGDFETSSRFIYYGEKTRNEYRLTRFNRGFPFREDENIGDLLVICKKSKDYYTAYILSGDEEIEDFLAAVNISSDQTNAIIPKTFEPAKNVLLKCFLDFLRRLKVDFPPTLTLAERARKCYNAAFNVSAAEITALPDEIILKWLNAEFDLFKVIENDRYTDRIKTPFASVEELVDCANTILNRRKSRAGKSLEHHLTEIFNTSGLKFQTQSITEDNKKPDFLFPGLNEYHNPRYDTRKLTMLASKTTCKDRWRQILNEADKIKTKHLFTLQQGISQNQLDEMLRYHVQLVVPKEYLTSFPKNYRNRILTLESFISNVKAKQA